MKQIKLKLKYDELQALDAIITNNLGMPSKHFADKCVMATLLDFVCKKIKPHLYFKFDKTKTITLSPAVACAMMHLHQINTINDPYCTSLMIRITHHIGPKM
jgi:hypothetical protein